VVLKSRPELLIFRLSLFAQSEPGDEPIHRYLIASRRGKRRLVRRSLTSGVGSPPFVSGDITEPSLREQTLRIYSFRLAGYWNQNYGRLAPQGYIGREMAIKMNWPIFSMLSARIF
jgi:hypothetical protein